MSEKLHIKGVAVRQGDKVLTKDLPAAHWELEVDLDPGKYREKLFLLSNGRTCTRPAAAKVAFEAGQTGRLRSTIYSNEIRVYEPDREELTGEGGE